MGLLTLGGCGGQEATVVVPPGTPHWLQARVAWDAAYLGDLTPSYVRFILGKRVYRIVLKGDFVCRNCSSPGGSWLPNGHTAWFDYDPKTRQEVEMAILAPRR